MQKLLNGSLLTLLALAAALSGCQNTAAEPSEESISAPSASSDELSTGEHSEEESVTEPVQTNKKDTDILVAYFSHTGTSREIAESIAEQTGGILYRIERETPYDEGYGAGEIAKEEWENDTRPPLKEKPTESEMAEYRKIILCYPIWWHTAPMVVGTFLESYDLSEVTVYPVSQSASMDFGYYEDSVTFIKSCAKGATVDNGIYTRDTETIKNYIDGIISE